ncbi:MAG TPA: energy transducer TonB [Candidatus Acidoferrales bacterium]|nr:energy transducer TonB [Candidatus Acidoferrales bacterium]
MGPNRVVILAAGAVLIALASSGAMGQPNAPVVQAPPVSSGVQQEQVTEPPGQIRVAADVEAKMLQHEVAPIYPAIAVAARVQGTVTLHAVIGPDGSIKELQYISGPPLLMRAAMNAVKQWKYKPFLLNGQPTEVDTSIPVVFAIGGTGAEESLKRKPTLAAKIQELLPDAQVFGAAWGYLNLRDFEDAVFAARDLDIPFAQLKCTELGGAFCIPQTTAKGMSLSTAIRVLKPEMSKDDVKGAEKKAKAEAKSIS